MNQRVLIATNHAPALVRAGGDRVQTSFWEFFVSNIRNAHTRRAYDRMVSLAPSLTGGRHCEERSDEAIQSASTELDCFPRRLRRAVAMTARPMVLV